MGLRKLFAVSNGPKSFNLFRDLLVAGLAVAAATGIGLLLIPFLHDGAIFLLFGIAVLTSAWRGGRRVGLVATALACFVGAMLFVRPSAEPVAPSLQKVALFTAEGCAISLLAGRLHAQRSRAEEQARDAMRARDEISDLIGSIPDGFLAVDPDFRLIFINRATQDRLGWSAEEVLGKTIWDQFPALDANMEQLLHRVMPERVRGSCETYYAPRGRWFAIHVSPFRDGISLLSHDISGRKYAEAERERLISELQAALAQVRTLRGLTPICAWCKKIRNDLGYWEQLELYLKNHSEADFTHGMCPDCARKYTEVLAGF